VLNWRFSGGFFWHVLMHVALIYMKEELPVEVMLIHFAVPMSLQGVTLGSKTIKNGFLILGTFFYCNLLLLSPISYFVTG